MFLSLALRVWFRLVRARQGEPDRSKEHRFDRVADFDDVGVVGGLEQRVESVLNRVGAFNHVKGRPGLGQSPLIGDKGEISNGCRLTVAV